MARDRLTVCELWDVTAPVLPPRSRLYHLAPIGLGTPYVESLSGYVARLAEAHNVRTLTLVGRELLSLLENGTCLKPELGHLASFWKRSSRALNGTGSTARDWTQALGQATLRGELRFLTLQPWAQVLALPGLLRPTRAWCPACYEEWRSAGREVYEPLLWAMGVVTVCPRHAQRLSTRCPHPECGQTSAPLEPRSRPGYCSWCERWLGIPPEMSPVDEQSLDEESRWQLWVAESAGELLAAAPTLPVLPRRERIAHAMTACVQQAARGRASVLARALGLAAPGAWAWLHGKSVPRLDLLFRLCDLLDISLLGFLTEEDLRVGAFRTDRPWRQMSRSPAPPRRPFDASRLRQALEQVLAGEEHPPPSMREVGRRLDYRAPDLYRHFPELCSAISSRYKAYLAARHRERMQRLRAEVRQAVLRVHEQGVFPSRGRVAALLARPQSLRELEVQDAWNEAVRELGW